MIAVVALAAGALLVAGTSASGPAGSGTYQVRAIFDDAAFAVTGEDVRVAGAPIGSITGLDVTPANKAAVTLSINDARFTPFYADATCAIRPQSLIGEVYVDCDPGHSSAPPLREIKRGRGSGQYLLPVTQTHSPIETDIVQSISQLPTRQQLSVIIDELGTGLAARGSDLNAVFHRANPALDYTTRVFHILAQQSRGLAQLADDSEAVLAPLARERAAIASFVTHAETTSAASATQSAATGQSVAKFPAFLRALGPLMEQVGALAAQGTPLFTSLGQAAPGLANAFGKLAPFAAAAAPAVTKLGAASAASQAPLQATLPLAKQLNSLGAALQPDAATLKTLTTSIDRTGGIEQLMNLLFYGTAATNGFDSTSHYARLQLIAGACSKYQTTTVPGCEANFPSASAAVARAAAAGAVRRAGAAKQVAAAQSLLRYLVGRHP